MGVFLDLEAPAVLLHHHAKIDIESRGVSGDGIVEGVLDIPAGELLVRGIHMRLDIFRIKIFYTVEPALVVDLSLPFPILVNHDDARNTEIGGNLLIISTESRGDMDNAGTILSGDIVAGDNPESLTFVDRAEPRNQLLIANSDEVGSFETSFKHFIRDKFVSRFVILERNLRRLGIEPCANQLFGKDIYRLLAGVRVKGKDPYIIESRAYAKGDVGRKSPRRGCPGQKIHGSVHSCE